MELIAIEEAIKLLPEALSHRIIQITTSNKAAASAVSQPQQQSGQQVIHRIYNTVADLRNKGNSISIAWIPSEKKPKLTQAAKKAARCSTKQDSTPNRRPFRTRSTTLSLAKRMHQSYKKLPEKIEKYSKKMDVALPGKHTRTLYNRLSWKEARILVQLYTGMARLNGYLHQVGVAPSD